MFVAPNSDCRLDTMACFSSVPHPTCGQPKRFMSISPLARFEKKFFAFSDRDPHLTALTDRLRRILPAAHGDRWPIDELAQCQQAGVYRWFVSTENGGDGWPEADLCRAYVAIARQSRMSRRSNVRKTSSVTHFAE